MNKLRTFLSLNINNTLKQKVAEIQVEIKKILSEHTISWENPEKLHMTLRFLGDMEEQKVKELINELSRTHFDFPNIRFVSNSIDFFPNKRKPNVIFLGLLEEQNNSEILTNEVDKVLQKFDIKPDKKFVPHITLGRFRRENRMGVGDINFPTIEKMILDFDRFYLMKSDMDYRGSKHYIIKDFLFKPQ